MRKSVLFASLAVVSFSVLGMENVPNFGNDLSHCLGQNRVNVSETNLQNSNIDFSFLNNSDNGSQQESLPLSLDFVDMPNLNLNAQTANPMVFSTNQQDIFTAYLLQPYANSAQTLTFSPNIPLNGVNLQNSNIDFSFLNNSDNGSQQESLPLSLDFVDMPNLNLNALDTNNFGLTDLDLSNLDFSLLNDIDLNIANDSGIKINQPLSAVLNSPNSATEKQETSASQNTDRKGKRKAEESENVQEDNPPRKRMIYPPVFRDPNVDTSSQSAVTEETSSLSSSQEMDNQHTSASPTASPMVFPANQQAISTEKLKEMIKLPEYPEGYKEDFFNAIEEDFNIDEATAKTVIAEWRIFYLEAFRSVRGLTEEKLNEWRSSSKILAQKNDPIFKDLITKIKEKKNELYSKYKEIPNTDNIRKLIRYHDFMLARLDDSCSYFYNLAICCNNNTRKSKKILSWLENHNLAERMYISDGEREGVLSQIIENKQFKKIQEIYPKLSKKTYDDYVRYIKYWFSFKEQEVFKKKINGEELDKELKPLDLKKSTLDTNALADLIRFGKSNFIEQYKDYSYIYYQYIASVWEILTAKSFEKPNWCNEDSILKEKENKKIETDKRRSESNKTAKNDTEVARNYLKKIYPQ